MAYRKALTGFRAEKKTPSWKKCVADDFRDYLFETMKKGQARSYIRLQFSAFRTFYRFLMERKGLRRDPVRELELPKAEKKLPLVLTRQQIDELLAAPLRVPKHRSAPSWMPQRDTAIMEVFYSSGLRLAELASLNVSDLDLYTESVRVLGKGRKERVCPVVRRLGSSLALPRGRQCAKRTAFHQQSASTNFPALDLAHPETLSASHLHSDLTQSSQTAAQFRDPPARRRRGFAQRAGLVRPRQSFDDPDLHPRHGRALEARL